MPILRNMHLGSWLLKNNKNLNQFHSDLKAINEWAILNDLLFNISKSFAMQYSKKEKVDANTV